MVAGSSFLTVAGATANFQGDIPDYFDDSCGQQVVKFIKAKNKDNPGLLVFAVPGAGKTRTIHQSAETAGATYFRVKLTDRNPMRLALMEVAKKHAGTLLDYEAAKGLLSAECTRFIQQWISILEERRELYKRTALG
jgi:hypothetical protein